MLIRSWRSVFSKTPVSRREPEPWSPWMTITGGVLDRFNNASMVTSRRFSRYIASLR